MYIYSRGCGYCDGQLCALFSDIARLCLAKQLITFHLNGELTAYFSFPISLMLTAVMAHSSDIKY